MFRSVDALDYMTAQPVIVAPDANIFTAIHLVIAHKVSGLSVVDKDNNLVGVISEIDCLRAILDGSYYNEVGGNVSDFMSLEIDSVTKHVDILAVAKRMVNDRRRRIPIVDNGKFIGQLSVRSILKAIKDFDVPEDKSEL